MILLFYLFIIHTPSPQTQTGQHWCWEWRSTHTPPRPCALVPSLPAVGSCFWWLSVWHAPSRCLPSTSPSIFLWDSRWHAPAPGLGDGQDCLWAAILPQVSMPAKSVFVCLLVCFCLIKTKKWNQSLSFGIYIKNNNRVFLKFHTDVTEPFSVQLMTHYNARLKILQYLEKKGKFFSWDVRDKSKLPEKWSRDWTLILQLCSVYIMLPIMCKSDTVHSGCHCAQKTDNCNS